MYRAIYDNGWYSFSIINGSKIGPFETESQAKREARKYDDSLRLAEQKEFAP
jgi:hypothetical protein